MLIYLLIYLKTVLYYITAVDILYIYDQSRCQSKKKKTLCKYLHQLRFQWSSQRLSRGRTQTEVRLIYTAAVDVSDSPIKIKSSPISVTYRQNQTDRTRPTHSEAVPWQPIGSMCDIVGTNATICLMGLHGIFHRD